MVLASGCGSKTLVRIGGGNLKALVVLLVLGCRGLCHPARHHGRAARGHGRHRGRHAAAGQDLPSLLAPAPAWARRTRLWPPAGGGGLGPGAGGWALARPEGRSAEVLLGGLGIGAVVAAVWWVSGRLGHLAEHPVTLEETFLATNSRAWSR
jgi:hypothetical protein